MTFQHFVIVRQYDSRHSSSDRKVRVIMHLKGAVSFLQTQTRRSLYVLLFNLRPVNRISLLAAAAAAACV
ncbi:hypothetical protein ACS0TY_021372 [Phlomoides rotata]